MLDDIDTSPIYSLGKFGQADPLMINYKLRNLLILVFINDLITTIYLAVKGLIPRASHAVPLLLDAISGPISMTN